MRESLIEKYLVIRVKLLGGEVRKLKWIGRAHAPDRLVLVPDQVPFMVELKATGISPRAGQMREHLRLKRLGLRVEVVDSFMRVDEVLS